MTSRTWGGNQKSSAHVIANISLGEGWVACTCGTTVRAARGLTTEDAWDIHRGKADLVYDRATDPERPWATDKEVSDFLKLVEDPTYEFDPDE